MKRKMSIARHRRRPIAWAGIVLALLPLAVLGGCLEADTLGGKPPDEVQVGSPPRWDNGMQALMTLKCGVCHQLPRPKHAPENTPGNLDFTLLSGSAAGGDGGGGKEVRGARDALERIHDLVSARLMPLEFATPLTEPERQAILDWDGS